MVEECIIINPLTIDDREKCNREEREEGVEEREGEIIVEQSGREEILKREPKLRQCHR
jgi:hypothetical protein